MSATTILAIYASVISTLTVGWRIHADVAARRTRIEFETFSGTPAGETWASVVVVVHNRSDRDFPMPEVIMRSGTEVVTVFGWTRPQKERLPARDSRMLSADDVPFAEGQVFRVEAEVDGKMFRSKQIAMEHNEPRTPISAAVQQQVMVHLQAERAGLNNGQLYEKMGGQWIESLNALIDLRKKGHVRLDNGRWIVVTPLV